MRRFAILALLALLSCPTVAESASDVELQRDTDLQRLQSALDAIRQEQQSVYQQFQMTEALQRSEMKSADLGMPSATIQDGRAPSYDDAVRSKQDQQDRIKYYAEEMRRLSIRYRELGNQGAALVEQIRVLAPLTR